MPLPEAILDQLRVQPGTAPVVPADHKHVTRALVAGILVHTVDRLQLSPPAVSPDKRAEIKAARARLSGH